MVEEKEISNPEIKNFIEHSFKIIITSFNDRLEKIESRLSDIESKVSGIGFKDMEKPLTSNELPKPKGNDDKKDDTDLSDALKLIGTK